MTAGAHESHYWWPHDTRAVFFFHWGSRSSSRTARVTWAAPSPDTDFTCTPALKAIDPALCGKPCIECARYAANFHVFHLIMAMMAGAQLPFSLGEGSWWSTDPLTSFLPVPSASCWPHQHWEYQLRFPLSGNGRVTKITNRHASTTSPCAARERAPGVIASSDHTPGCSHFLWGTRQVTGVLFGNLMRGALVRSPRSPTRLPRRCPCFSRATSSWRACPTRASPTPTPSPSSWGTCWEGWTRGTRSRSSPTARRGGTCTATTSAFAQVTVRMARAFSGLALSFSAVPPEALRWQDQRPTGC